MHENQFWCRSCIVWWKSCYKNGVREGKLRKRSQIRLKKESARHKKMVFRRKEWNTLLRSSEERFRVLRLRIIEKLWMVYGK